MEYDRGKFSNQPNGRLCPCLLYTKIRRRVGATKGKPVVTKPTTYANRGTTKPTDAQRHRPRRRPVVYSITDAHGNECSLHHIRPLTDGVTTDRWFASWTATSSAGVSTSGRTDFTAWNYGGALLINDEQITDGDEITDRDLRAVVLDVIWFATVRVGAR